jgi:hypothetical protein
MSDENAAALLVFDASRVHPLDGAPHTADAVVGILTERGARLGPLASAAQRAPPRECVFLRGPRPPPPPPRADAKLGLVARTKQAAGAAPPRARAQRGRADGRASAPFWRNEPRPLMPHRRKPPDAADYLHKVVVKGRSSFRTPVKDVMTPQAQVRARARGGAALSSRAGALGGRSPPRPGSSVCVGLGGFCWVPSWCR